VFWLPGWVERSKDDRLRQVEQWFIVSTARVSRAKQSAQFAASALTKHRLFSFSDTAAFQRSMHPCS